MRAFFCIARPFAVVVTMLSLSFSAAADYALNMTQGVTPLSREIYDLHMLVLWVCVAIGVVVFGVMFFSLFRFRRANNPHASQFSHSTLAEVVWTIIPVLILIAMAVPATSTLRKIEDVSNAEMSVKVTGYQWKWHYDYMEEGIDFFSVLPSEHDAARKLQASVDLSQIDNYLLDVDKPLVLPVDTKIRILSTANNVLHSWWVPALGWKRDAIPGFINESWALIDTPGIYRGQCAELCGDGHAFMPIVVKAVPKAEYVQWVAEMKQTQAQAAAADSMAFSAEELLSRGRAVYMTNCAACHQATGTGLPGIFPSLVGTKITIGPAEDHVKLTLNGVAGTAMAAFGAQLSDADLAAVVSFERSEWGNAALIEQAGHTVLVQPTEVGNLRSK